MAYPIKDAGYKHEPPWLDRAKEGERHSKVPYRQDGGQLPRTTPAGGMDQVDMDNAVKDHENNMRFTQGPLSAAVKGLQNRRNTPLPSNWDDATGRRRGGKVKRADGGGLGTGSTDFSSNDKFGYSQDETPMTAGERLAAAERRLHLEGKHGDDVLPKSDVGGLMFQAAKDYFNPRVRSNMDPEGAALSGKPFDGKSSPQYRHGGKVK